MKPRVLVLDNDASLGELLALALERGGVEPRVVSRATEAEEVLQDGAVDFLVLDLNLGGGDSGERLALRWHEAGLLVPFLMLTGTPLDERLSLLEGLPGFRGVLAKPFSVLELARHVRQGCASTLHGRELEGGR